jgi:hypothetical protein
MKMMAGALPRACSNRSRRADANEHLHELGAGDGEEGHLRLARHRLGEQRLARAGRAHQQHALGHPPAQAAVALGLPQEVHDLAQLVLGLVHAGDVLERDAGVGLDIDLGLALADLHQAALAPGEAAAEEVPDADEEQDRQEQGQQVAQQRALDPARVAHAVAVQLVGDLGLDAGGGEARLAPGQGLLEAALDEAVGDARLRHLAVAHQLLELAVGYGGDPLRQRSGVLDAEDGGDRGHPVQ